MEQFKLTNGISIPKIGLGVWQSGEQTEQAVSWALQEGYRHIDTASFYKNERQVGRAIQSSGIPRNQIFITTKLWVDDIQLGRLDSALQDSMERLGVDYLDLYLIHWPIGNYVDCWKRLEEYYHMGKLKAIGVSNFEPKHLEKLLSIAEVTPMVNQIEIHPYFIPMDTVSLCKQEGIALEAWGPLGKGTDINDPVIIRLAEKYRKTPAQIILRWHYQNGIITIPKTVHRQRMAENLSIFDFALDQQDMNLIQQLNTGVSNRKKPDGYQ